MGSRSPCEGAVISSYSFCFLSSTSSNLWEKFKAAHSDTLESYASKCEVAFFVNVAYTYQMLCCDVVQCNGWLWNSQRLRGSRLWWFCCWIRARQWICKWNSTKW